LHQFDIYMVKIGFKDSFFLLLFLICFKDMKNGADFKEFKLTKNASTLTFHQ